MNRNELTRIHTIASLCDALLAGLLSGEVQTKEGVEKT
jgi:hypothetical protein